MNSPSKVWKGLRRCTYPRADVVVVQTEAALRSFSRAMRSSALIIPNPVVRPSPSRNDLSFALVKPLAASVGRLTHVKGFDLVLHAFARVRAMHPQWTLAIVGDGPLLSTLERLCDELRIRDRVLFTGRIKDPGEILKLADLFVMSSRFEGFPNALCEAMAHGVAVISTDCPSGPRAIIRNNIDGVLTPNGDVEALAEAMDRLMADEVERRRLGQIAKYVTHRFGLDKVMAMWEIALGRALSQEASALHHADAGIARAR
jgi:glycosyltransferase involved in cell wall biosynthesis